LSLGRKDQVGDIAEFLDPAKLIEQRRDAFGRASELILGSIPGRDGAISCGSSNERRKLAPVQCVVLPRLACGAARGTASVSRGSPRGENAALPASTTITSWSGVKVLPALPSVYRHVTSLPSG
jgi:hypothetical protein